jgi:Tfp pilus assembly protein PilF
LDNCKGYWRKAIRFTDKLHFIKNLILILSICFSFGLSVSCQTKPQTAEEIVNLCQAFLEKDDLQGANECVQKAMFANPQMAEEISRISTSAIFQKCHDFKNRKDYKQAIIKKRLI